jgi:hypothetical protein
MSDDATKSLIGLCSDIGFEAVDAEIEAWIAMGEFDEQVAQRAEELGWYKPGTRWADIETEPLF